MHAWTADIVADGVGLGRGLGLGLRDAFALAGLVGEASSDARMPGGMLMLGASIFCSRHWVYAELRLELQTLGR
jgi:hypothetical protein